jgi:hypothetical protein
MVGVDPMQEEESGAGGGGCRVGSACQRGREALTARTHVSAAEIGQGIPIRSVLGWAVGQNRS